MYVYYRLTSQFKFAEEICSKVRFGWPSNVEVALKLKIQIFLQHVKV